MTDKITEPMPPETLDPLPLDKLAGDWTDDDAQVYDEDFMAANHGDEADAKGVPHSKPSLKPATRILHRNVIVGTVNGVIADPVLVLPADPNRKSLTLFAYGDTQMYWTFGDSKSDCYNGNLYPVYPTTIARSWPTLDLDGHTGSVWAWSATGATPITVVAVAVTE